jgi:hypothetical protein
MSIYKALNNFIIIWHVHMMMKMMMVRRRRKKRMRQAFSTYVVCCHNFYGWRKGTGLTSQL